MQKLIALTMKEQRRYGVIKDSLQEEEDSLEKLYFEGRHFHIAITVMCIVSIYLSRDNL